MDQHVLLGRIVDSATDLTHEVLRLRKLLRIEHALINCVALPWNCVESDCPYFGKPVTNSCRCADDFAKEHRAAVQKEIGHD